MAAFADVMEENIDSCGLCYEVKCDPTFTSSIYNENFDRRGTCYNPNASVVVRIVDVCPCNYPPNAYANKRWCCGDRDHMDISLWAFEKLADLKWGIIPTLWRKVPCDYIPLIPAAAPTKPSPGDPPSPPSNAVRSIRDWVPFTNPAVVPVPVFKWGYLQNEWFDSSWKAASGQGRKGIDGASSICATINQGGALRWSAGNSGIFTDHVSIEFWLYVGYPGSGGVKAQIPEVTVTIAGPKGGCEEVRIVDVKPYQFVPTCTFCSDYWWSWKIYLPLFSGSGIDTIINQPSDFKGCGGNAVADLDSVVFMPTWGNQQPSFCIDHVLLF